MKSSKRTINWKRISIVTAVALVSIFVLSFVTIKAFEFFQPIKRKYFKLEVNSVSDFVKKALDNSKDMLEESQKLFNQDFVNNSRITFNIEGTDDELDIINQFDLTMQIIYNKKEDWESNKISLNYDSQELLGLRYIFNEEDLLIQVPKLFSKTLSIDQKEYKNTLLKFGLSEKDIAGMPEVLEDLRSTRVYNPATIKEMRDLWEMLVIYHKVFYNNLENDKVKFVNGTTFKVDQEDIKCNEYIVTFDNEYIKKSLIQVLDLASKDEKLLGILKKNKLFNSAINSDTFDLEEAKAFINSTFESEGTIVNHVYELKGKIIGRKIKIIVDGAEQGEISSGIKFSNTEKYFDLIISDDGIPVADLKFISKITDGVEKGTTSIMTSEGNVALKKTVKQMDSNDSSLEVDYTLSNGETSFSGKCNFTNRVISEKKMIKDLVLSFGDNENKLTFNFKGDYSAEPTKLEKFDDVLELENATSQDFVALQSDISQNAMMLMMSMPKPILELLNFPLDLG